MNIDIYENMGDMPVSGLTSKNDSWDTREGDVRREIFKMTMAQNNISFVYKETLRAMIASFADIGYINAENEFVDVKCIHANAERAIAKFKQDNKVILPILSVSQTVTNNDRERQRQEGILVQEKTWDPEKNRAVRVLSLAPRPVNITYQLNIWSKYRSDMDQILEQIRLKFNPEMQVPTPHSTITKAYLDSEENVGDFTANDKEDRLLQKTITVVVRTYVPNPKFIVTSTGKVEKFNAEVC